VRENVNPVLADEEASLLLSPAPAGVHTKMATIINPATKIAFSLWLILHNDGNNNIIIKILDRSLSKLRAYLSISH